MRDLKDGARALREVLARREPVASPEDKGRLLGAIRRTDDRELRIVWTRDLRRGAPVLAFRVWHQEPSGWFPVRGMGFTVRIRELGDFATAVAQALGPRGGVAEDRRR